MLPMLPELGSAHDGTTDQVQDVGAGEGHEAADPGPCTMTGLGEVSDEAYPHQTTEGPERTPVV